MDNAYNISSGKIIRALAEAEVMSIFFPRVGKALIVDTRHNADHGPVVLMDDMVSSAKERLQSVRRLRPEFTEIAQLTLAPWLGSTRAFAEQGIFDAIIERFRAMGFHDAAHDAICAFRELRRHERQMMLDLIAGETQTTRTLWSRRSS
ncbi:MAG: hypothetical protein LC793_20015 [Thermomicrobia bacterium]|nr:hypothetical protein [Thermomicrobia bacterium]